MRELPILFSTEMVRAILDGRKTMTRRICKDANDYCEPLNDFIDNEKRTYAVQNYGDLAHTDYVSLCKVKMPICVGDILIPAKEITGYDIRYCADFFGNIWSKASGEWKQLKSQDTAGYLRLTLRKGGKDVNRTVHKLVCTTYYGDLPFKGAVVRHLDGNSMNNAPDNLDWGTCSQNWGDAKYHGTKIHEKHHNAKITMEIAENMRASGKHIQDLAKEYGLNHKTVQRILNNETWRSVYEQVPPNYPRAAARIWLEVTDVRVERLQEIKSLDIDAEGTNTDGLNTGMECRYAFECLWNSTVNKQDLPLYGWDANPWVWVYEFKRLEVRP
jgi:hypothetical protein